MSLVNGTFVISDIVLVFSNEVSNIVESLVKLHIASTTENPPTKVYDLKINLHLGHNISINYCYSTVNNLPTKLKKTIITPITQLIQQKKPVIKSPYSIIRPYTGPPLQFNRSGCNNASVKKKARFVSPIKNII